MSFLAYSDKVLLYKQGYFSKVSTNIVADITLNTRKSDQPRTRASRVVRQSTDTLYAGLRDESMQRRKRDVAASSTDAHCFTLVAAWKRTVSVEYLIRVYAATPPWTVGLNRVCN